MLAGELKFAGDVTRVDWNASAAVTGAGFGDAEITLCETSLGELSTSFAGNYGGNTPALIYSNSWLVITTTGDQWFGFDFAKPFAYNGRDNLVVEVWWVDDTNGGGNTQWNFPVSGRCCFSYIVNGNPQNGYPDKGLVSYFMHYMRATVSPTAVERSSFGRVRALFS